MGHRGHLDRRPKGIDRGNEALPRVSVYHFLGPTNDSEPSTLEARFPQAGPRCQLTATAQAIPTRRRHGEHGALDWPMVQQYVYASRMCTGLSSSIRRRHKDVGDHGAEAPFHRIELEPHRAEGGGAHAGDGNSSSKASHRLLSEGRPPRLIHPPPFDGGSHNVSRERRPYPTITLE